MYHNLRPFNYYIVNPLQHCVKADISFHPNRSLIFYIHICRLRGLMLRPATNSTKKTCPRT